MNRRYFVATALSAARVLGANDRIRVGVIGSGVRGSYLARDLNGLGADVAAICDVYAPNRDAGLRAASPGARGLVDYRELLDDKSLDAVVIATPDHWHAKMFLDSVAAGKDVYLEKPMALTVEDGFRMVEAARRNKRVVQVGTQRRSNPLFHEEAEMLQSGIAGEVRLVNSWWYNTKTAVRRTEPAGELDWERWQGPAPHKPFDAARFWDWLYFWEYSSGMMAGQGAHIIDAIQMLMNSTWPVAVTCTAPKPFVEGAEFHETTCLAVEFPGYLAVFTTGYKAMRYTAAADQMKQFNGTLARFDVARESYALYPQSLDIEPKPTQQKRVPGSFVSSTRAHVQNFLDCVKSRNEPNAPIEMGQYTNVVLCMGRESLRQGRRLVWDAAARKVV